MASRTFSKATRSPLTRQLTLPVVQRRAFVSALGGVRATIAGAERNPQTAAVVQTRGVKTIDFAGHKETVFGVFGTSCFVGDSNADSV
jgi:ketol-acid reductoisomerase